MKELLTQLKTLLQKNKTDPESQNQLMVLLNELDKESLKQNFKFNRLMKDKQVMVNVLNQTINELEEQKKVVEEQSRFKEKLFANVSHELRTPLNGILGMSHLLDGTTLGVQQQKYVSTVKVLAEDLTILVNDILNFAKINADQLKIYRLPFCSKTLFEHIYQLFEMKANGKGVWLDFKIAPTVPSYLTGDMVRIQQILINLLNNALKFTHQGGVTLEVTFIPASSNEEGELLCKIIDTGIGIEENQLLMIFESFTQVHEHKNAIYEGTGLGLNIVKRLLDLMEGTIQVESEVGKGSCFSFRLNMLLPIESEVAGLKKNNINQVVIPNSWRQAKILCVEDNKANALYLENILLNWNMTAEIACNLKEAELKLNNYQFDCILTDVQLPDGNGLNFMEKMRQNANSKNQETPIIVLTAGANSIDEKRSKSLKIEAYIGKPFSPQILLRAFALILGEAGKNLSKRSPVGKAIPPTYSNQKSNPTLIEGIVKEGDQYLAGLFEKVGGREKYILEFIDIFLEQIPETLAKLSIGIEQHSWDIIQNEAHKIKSTIHIMGLQKLLPFILEIDRLSYRKEQFERLPHLFLEFKQQANIDMEKVKLIKAKLQPSIPL